MSGPRGLGDPAGWPPRVRERFAAWDLAALGEAASEPLVVGRLLEDGDGDELRWLAARVGRQALAAFVARHGARRLSRRSRAFWACVLGVVPAEPAAIARELWPLA